MMKVSWLWCLSVVASAAASGGIYWPGAIPVAHEAFAPLATRLQAYTATFGIPPYSTLLAAPTTKGFAYSSTQFIKSPPFSIGLKPQLAYQVPQFSYDQLQAAGFYPTISSFIFPGSVGVFPSPNVPIISEKPAEIAPGTPASQPSPQPSTDLDSTVIESADSDRIISSPPSIGTQFPEQPATAFPEIPSAQQPQIPPASTFPIFSPTEQDSSSPSFPSIQFPQGSIPNFPQFPQLPQFPLFPQSPGNPAPTPQEPSAPAPTSPPTSFPAADGSDKGINDEDTISVDSA